MFILHGVYNLGHKRVACRNDLCTTCCRPTFAVGIRSFMVLHVFFVPVLPLGFHRRWFCTVCKREIDARRPVRSWILILGLLLGLFLLSGGILVLMYEPKPVSKLELLGPGLAITFGFGFAIRRSCYKPFLAAKKGVVPLSDSQCPLCAGPLLPRVTPHCYKCDIDICR